MNGSSAAPTPSAMKDRLNQLLVQVSYNCTQCKLRREIYFINILLLIKDDDDQSLDDNIQLQLVEETDTSGFMQGFFTNVRLTWCALIVNRYYYRWKISDALLISLDKIWRRSNETTM